MRDVVFTRNLESRFIVERLPDGSAAIFDTTTEAVHSLNASAVIAWDCCAESARLTDVVEALGEAGLSVANEVAERALGDLERAALVIRKGDRPAIHLVSSRRSLLRTAALGSAALALPVVLTLTGAEQRVYAQGVGSGTTTTSTTAPP